MRDAKNPSKKLSEEHAKIVEILSTIDRKLLLKKTPGEGGKNY